MNILDSLPAAPAAPAALSVEEENLLISTAQETVTFGTSTVPTAAAQAAKESLLAAYARTIRKAIARNPHMDADEVEADLVECILKAIASHDTTTGVRLASRLPVLFRDALKVAGTAAEAFSISTRQRTRFYAALYAAEGDLLKARSLATLDPHVSDSSFLSMAAALLGVDSVESLAARADSSRDEQQVGDIHMTPLGGEESDSVENVVERKILTEYLLGLLTARQRLVIMLSYGFVTESLTSMRLGGGYQFDECLTDSQIVVIPEVGLTARRSIIRERQAAMETMRAALGVTDQA